MAKRSSSPSGWWKASRSRKSGAALLISALLLICAVWAQGEKGTDASSGRATSAKEARNLQAKQTKKLVGDTLRGRAVKVQDGDTFDFLYGDHEKQRVRVAQMDAPEKAMPFGQKSKERFSELVIGKEIALVVNTVDRYGRIVGSVVIDGEDQSARMISEGMAWYYRQYGWTDSLARLEEEARSEKRGLWADPNPQPPWEWRKENRGKKKQ